MDTAMQAAEQKTVSVLPDSELSGFCAQMGLILQSGLSTTEGLSVMLEDARDEEEKALLNSLLEETEQTGDFSGALEKSGFFPEYMTRMCRIGEETGTLDSVMNGLSDHFDREDSVRRSVRNAVTYPLVMTAMMAAVIVVLLVEVMPIFNRVFIQLGTEMTGFSRMLMDLGTAISRYAVVFAAVVALIIAAVVWCSRTESGARFAAKLSAKLGLGRKLREKAAACRLADGLSLTLGSGLSPDRCLELASTLVDDLQIREKLEKCRRKVDEGGDLIRALHEEGLFSGIYARMASIGSRTGSLDRALSRIAKLYQDEIDGDMSNLLAILEPALVIAVSLIVGGILLSVMLPLLGIMSGI